MSLPPVDEHLTACLTAGVYEPGQPPGNIVVLFSGAVGHIQFDIYADLTNVWICFAGSNEPRDWLRHTRVRRSPLPASYQPSALSTAPRLTAHRGWLHDARDVLPLIGMTLHDLRRTRRLICCGHSYGGPLAILIAYMLATDWPSAAVAIRTYGSPATGNAALAAAVDAAIPDHIRYANPADIVARLPLGRYAHCGRLYPVPAGWPGHPSGKYRDWILEHAPQTIDGAQA